MRGFIVDFYCAELRLLLELEGDAHASPQRLAYDRERAAILRGAGYRIARVRNEDLSEDGLRRLIAEVLAASS